MNISLYIKGTMYAFRKYALSRCQGKRIFSYSWSTTAHVHLLGHKAFSLSLLLSSRHGQQTLTGRAHEAYVCGDRSRASLLLEKPCRQGIRSTTMNGDRLTAGSKHISLFLPHFTGFLKAAPKHLLFLVISLIHPSVLGAVFFFMEHQID